MKHIGLDMDGVIVDFMSPICKKLGVDYDSIKDYNLEKQFPDKIDEIRKIYGKEGYFYNLKSYNGSTFLINNLLNLGLKVWFISKPSSFSPITYSDKIKWVKKHFPDLFKTTILTQDKERCYVDIFVDDDIRNIERNISDNKILFSQPWNKNYSGKYKVAKNYTDLLRIVKEII